MNPELSLYIQYGGMLLSCLAIAFGAIRMVLKYYSKRNDDMSLQICENAARMDKSLGEVQSEMRFVARDVSDIKKSITSYVTRDEFAKTVGRLHDRIDHAEHLISKADERIERAEDAIFVKKTPKHDNAQTKGKK